MWISQPSIGSCPVWTPSSRPLGGATGRASALRRTASSSSFREKIHLPVCLRPPSGAGKIVLDHCQDVSSRAAIHTYFSTLLDLKGAEAQDAHHILPLMESEFFPFRTVAERFHLIESPTTTVYLPLEEGAGLVELLRSGQYSRTLYRRLGQYGVSVYRSI